MVEYFNNNSLMYIMGLDSLVLENIIICNNRRRSFFYNYLFNINYIHDFISFKNLTFHSNIDNRLIKIYACNNFILNDI